MAGKNLMQRALAALTGGERMNSEDLQKARAEVQERLAEVEERVKAIAPGYPETTERRRVLASGSTEDLVNLDREYEQLQAEEKQLRFRQSELAQAVKEARALETIANAKSLHRNLADAVANAEQAQAKAQAAISDAERAAREITSGRQLCKQQGMAAQSDELAVESELARRLADLSGVRADQHKALIRDLAGVSRNDGPAVGRLRGMEG